MSLPNEPPGPALQRPPARPWDRPETEFPVPVPAGTLLLVRSEVRTIAVTCVLAYSNGFEFFVTHLLRPGTPVFAGLEPAPPGTQSSPATREPLDIGVESADGRRYFRSEPPDDGKPAGPVLHFAAATGNSHRSDARWWTWPLPPPGRLDFICRLDGTETRASVEAQLILDAAQRSAQPWPVIPVIPVVPHEAGAGHGDRAGPG